MPNIKSYFSLLLRMQKVVESKTFKDAIFLRSEDADRLRKIEPVLLANDRNFSLGIYAYLLKYKYKKIESNFLDKDLSMQKVMSVTKNSSIDYGSTHNLSRVVFIKAADMAKDAGLITDDDYHKLDYLRHRSTYEAFLEDTKGKTYSYSNSYKKDIPVSIEYMNELLTLPYDDIKEVLGQNPFGLTDREMAHCLRSYFIGNCMHDRYFLPPELIKKVYDLKDEVDTLTLDLTHYDEPYYLPLVSVDKELWNKILGKAPEDFNQLETAYYIYYQLCKTFTYSKDYFTMVESSKVSSSTMFDKSISSLPKYNEENNELVCYEIMAIYQKFLHHLGIKFDVQANYGRGGEVPYDAHSVVNMVIDEFYIEADATRGVIAGDMPLAKENLPLEGFKCMNNQQTTVTKFYESINKVNEYIQETEKQENSFYDVVNAYMQKTTTPTITPEERLKILIESVESSPLSETDQLVHINELTKRLFPARNCDSYFILEHTEENPTPDLVVMFAYLGEDIDTSTETTYIACSKTKGTRYMSQEEVQKMFDDEDYEYMYKYRKDLPDISVPVKGGMYDI